MGIQRYDLISGILGPCRPNPGPFQIKRSKSVLPCRLDLFHSALMFYPNFGAPVFNQAALSLSLLSINPHIPIFEIFKF